MGFSEDQPGVYFATDEDVALSFTECSELTPDVFDSCLVVIEVDLDEDEIELDTNNLDGTTYIYNGIVKDFLSVSKY